ncbi:hypothetical protein [Nocardioides lianchengensis]|uniref:Uncharacterized protein n=1 Tax=Nocardioides lianchengensis TaxID=1045774 RepID=A0A1G6NGP0_9ACTN|nr:hypothetical protein [Nocardioides lianchengensis]NYG10767.1 hypothetical protein [Nocardioides lianchengensis]SDC67019.1 hypothetical protein SAMN05421872_103250 [Nocardioides lianchengensis]
MTSSARATRDRGHARRKRTDETDSPTVEAAAPSSPVPMPLNRISRTPLEGAHDHQESTGTAFEVRRAPEPTIHRFFGLFGSTAVGNLREGEIGSDDEAVPLEFIDLADTLQAVPQLKDAEGLKFDGKAFDKAETFAGTEAMKGFGGTMSVLGGAKEMLGGALEAKDSVENLWHAYQKYDFGLGDGARGDSIGKNLGAVQMESAATSLLTGGLGVTSGGSSLAGMSDLAGEQIPFLDVAVNGVQGTIKAKKAIEDSVASGKLGRQRTHIKREQDTFLPEDVRGERFGEFVTALKTGGKVKGSDRKRWHEFHVAWVAHASGLTGGTYDVSAPDPDAAKAKKKPVATPPGGGGTGAPAIEFNPLTTTWSDATQHAAEKKAFLEFLRTTGKKDFGYGTKLRTKYEDGLKSGGTRAEGSQDYEQMRDLGKVASFGQRRKAETATINSVEAVGHFADAAGTFTAGGDMGATKATGKAIKATSALYKSLKTLVKRGRRVHKLREAKNEMEYGGKGDRGVLWGAKQFFFGNVDSQQKKARGALNAAVSAPERAEKAHQDALVAWQTRKDAYDAYVEELADYDEGKRLIMDLMSIDETEFERRFPPGPVKVDDPGTAPVKGAAPTTGRKEGVANAKTAKVMTAEQAKPLIKKLTIQCKRKVDDLITCLLSDNETVRLRAREILHIVAENNLAGAIAKIDDQDLEILYKVAKQMRTDPSYKSNAQHVAEFKRRKSAIKEIVTGQLSGVGG